MGISVTTPPEEMRSKMLSVTSAQLKKVQGDLLLPGGFTPKSESTAILQVGKKTFPARDFTGTNKAGLKISGRIVSVNRRLFQVLSFHPADKPLDAEHQRFVAGFQPIL